MSTKPVAAMTRGLLVAVAVLACPAPGAPVPLDAGESPAATALNGAVEPPLVSVHARVTFKLLKSSLAAEDLFTTRAGTAIGASSFLGDVAAASWTARTASGVATARQLRDLELALDAAHVGVQRDCAITELGPWTGTVYDVTWFGQRARQNHFVVTFQAFASERPECPAEVERLLRALETYARQALGLSVFSPFAS